MLIEKANYSFDNRWIFVRNNRVHSFVLATVAAAQGVIRCRAAHRPRVSPCGGLELTNNTLRHAASPIVVFLRSTNTGCIQTLRRRCLYVTARAIVHTVKVRATACIIVFPNAIEERSRRDLTSIWRLVRTVITLDWYLVSKQVAEARFVISLISYRHYSVFPSRCFYGKKLILDKQFFLIHNRWFFNYYFILFFNYSLLGFGSYFRSFVDLIIGFKVRA